MCMLLMYEAHRSHLSIYIYMDTYTDYVISYMYTYKIMSYDKIIKYL